MLSYKTRPASNAYVGSWKLEVGSCGGACTLCSVFGAAGVESCGSREGEQQEGEAEEKVG